MTVRYTFDPRVSRFTVQAFAGGALRMFAHNPTLGVRDFSGEIRFDPETLDNASAHVTVKAASLQVTDDFSSKDRQEIERIARDDVLEVSRNPEIKYESTSVTVRKAGGAARAKMKGNLTLHGKTKDHEIEATLAVLGDMIRLSGTSTLKQADFGIKPVKAAGGMIATKDEVKVSFDIVARKETEGG